MQKKPDGASFAREQVPEQSAAREQPANHQKPRAAAGKEKSKDSPMDSFKKWLGLVAAVLSVSSAIYGVLKFQAEKRELAGVVEERLTAGRMELGAKDYGAAWVDLQAAAKAAKGAGLLVNLLGGLSAEQRQVRTAQEDLAMEWLRKVVLPRYASHYDIADKVLDFLTSDAASASGSRKADLLAHIGWAHFCTKAAGATGGEPIDVEDALYFYREAIALDPSNPYANVFWGSTILQGSGGDDDSHVAEASKHFAAALTTKRERATVRKFQLTSLSQHLEPASNKAYLAALYQMLQAGEPLGPFKEVALFHYDSALEHGDPELKTELTELPPAHQVELLHALLTGTDPLSRYGVSGQIALALALEAVGKPGDALAVWRKVQEGGVYMKLMGKERGAQVDAAIKRLTAVVGQS